MINVSDDFKKTMRNRTNFEEEATITLEDGTELELTGKDFTVSNNYMTEGAGVEQIPIGVAVSKSVQIEIMNDDEHLSVYDYFGAVINLRLKFSLEERSETIQLGRYTVISPATKGETVIISAVDDMWKTNGKYATELTYPTTARSVLEDICQKCDLILADVNFKNSNFQIINPIDNSYTYRAVIGYIAMIACGNAIIDRFGKLRILSYNFAAFDDLQIVNGGTFNPWNNPSSLDGGTFNPWNGGDVADGGVFEDRSKFHMLYQWKELNVCSDDVVITGVKVDYYGNEGEDQNTMEGSEGYVLAVSNPLISGKEPELAKLLGDALIGASFRKFEGEHISYPLAEFMDPALIIDRKNNAYKTYLTDITFNFCGGTTLKNCAEEALRNSSTYIDESTQAYIEARKLVAKERSERDKAVANLASLLASSGGLYMTKEVQEDGSVVYYMHDKPTLAESGIVWKFTALAFAISTDGGKTYPYGFTVDGETVTKLLYAEGIDADYIKAGSVTVGNADNPNGEVITLGKDKSGKSISAKMSGGRILLYADNTLAGTLGSLASSSEPQGVGLTTAQKSLGLGTKGADTDSTSIYYYLNNGLNPNGLTERHLFNGLVRFLSAARMRSIYLIPSSTSADESEWVQLYVSSYDGVPSLISGGGVYSNGSIGCSGTKYRVVETEHYGKRGMNAFETAEAFFSDIGSGEIGENGEYKIEFDPIFEETIDVEKPYQVQITPTSELRTAWVEKQKNSFVVHGERGATFDWMIMCRQKGYSDIRMKEVVIGTDD